MNIKDICFIYDINIIDMDTISKKKFGGSNQLYCLDDIENNIINKNDKTDNKLDNIKIEKIVNNKKYINRKIFTKLITKYDIGKNNKNKDKLKIKYKIEKEITKQIELLNEMTQNIIPICGNFQNMEMIDENENEIYDSIFSNINLSCEKCMNEKINKRARKIDNIIINYVEIEI